MPFFEKKHTANRVDFDPPPGTLSNAVGRVYAQTARLPLPTEIYGAPQGFEEVLKLPYLEAGQPVPVMRSCVDIKRVEFKNTNKVAVAFSGGNDSAATALSLAASGYEPQLFYVSGINNSYPNEQDVAREFAAFVDMPFTVKRAKLLGGTDFKEPPIKDQLILAMMLEFAVEVGAGNTAYTGNEEKNFAKDSNLMYNWSDSVEMHLAMQSFARQFAPGYTVGWVVEHRTDSIARILKHKPDALKYTMSCMQPYRFQKMRRTHNTEKYKVDLRPNRCGSCYKCCAEYLNTVAMGHDDPNTDFMRHCFRVFKEKMPIIYKEGYGSDFTDKQIIEDIVSPKFADPSKLYGYLL